MCAGTGGGKTRATRRAVNRGLAARAAKKLRKDSFFSATAKASRRSTRTGGAGVNASNMQ